MLIPIWLFCLLMFLSFCSGIGVYALYVKRLKEMTSVTNGIRANWFWIVFLIVFVYVISNFEECINLHFTKEFNGNNLIFLLLIVLSILPMFESIKAHNISIKLYNQSKNIKESEDNYKKAITDAETKALRDKNRHGGKGR